MPRLLLPASVHDLFRPTLARLMRTLRTGDLEDFRTSVAPLPDAPSFTRVKDHLAACRAENGVRVIHGGRADDARGFLVEPTVVTLADTRARAFTEDPAGPVLALGVVPDADVLPTVRALPRGAALSVFGRDRGAVQGVVDAVGARFGAVFINDVADGAAGLPWVRGAPGSSGGVEAFTRRVVTRECFDPPYDVEEPVSAPEGPSAG